MSRLSVLKRFSREAGGAETALTNPLALLSDPIFIRSTGERIPNNARWEWPDVTVDGCRPEQFRDFFAGRRLFVIGGFQLIVELGLLPSWYCESATRQEAKTLIRQRNWDELLERLQGKEHQNDDLFGQKAIRDFFSASPPVRRLGRYEISENWRYGNTEDRRWTSDSASEVASQEFLFGRGCWLRLRKAIEFIVLTEAILRYRFSRGLSLTRFGNATGLHPRDAYPEVVWDYLWIEPTHYCVSSPARVEDLELIVGRSDLAEQFRLKSGQAPSALSGAIKGAPGRYRTIAAACDILNDVYSGLATAVPRTVLPSEYRTKMILFKQKSLTTGVQS